MGTKIARVALDVPVATLFDYRLPERYAASIGCRALVPFGRRTAVGVVMEVGATTAVAAERLKDVIEVYPDSTLCDGD